MLERTTIKIDGKQYRFGTDLRNCKDLPLTLQFWMAYMARDMLQLGVFFRAAGIMLQLPGAAQYEFVDYDVLSDDPGSRMSPADKSTVFNILAECLRRLGGAGAEALIEQVPGAADYQRVELSDEWKKYLDRQATIEHGLLNVVAACLDRLLVRPGMFQIDRAPVKRKEPNPTWWERLWAEIPSSGE